MLELSKKEIPCIGMENFRILARDVLNDSLKNGDLRAAEILGTGIPKLDTDNLDKFVEWFMAHVLFDTESERSLPYVFIIDDTKAQWIVSGLDCHILASSSDTRL